ncbi:MAG: LamG domain-containing protein [Bacteroidetes bacterium]|nr:LamG domain-containing protein [Bacteroidota bacterium]
MKTKSSYALYLGSPERSRRVPYASAIGVCLILTFYFITLQTSNSHAQGVAINTTGADANASAMLDVSSTASPFQGTLITRLTTANRDLISSPSDGLIIYNIDCKEFQYYNGTRWISLLNSSSLVASVSISANPSNTICSGASVTFTATPVNGGTIPDYQWNKNGTAINGATNSTYTSSTLANNDAINCILTSNAICSTIGSPATSNTITASVMLTPTTANAGSDQNLICGSSSTTLAGNTPTAGTGAWTIVSGTAAITTPGSPISTLTGISDNVVLRWTISNSPCTDSYDDVSIFYLTDDASTKLKIHANGADNSTSFIDASLSPHTVTTNGDAKVSSSPAKFSQSAIFDGVGDYLTIPNSSDWDFGTSDFTVDFWVYVNGNQTGAIGLITAKTNGVSGGWSIFWQDGNTGKLYINKDNSDYFISTGTVSQSAWTHVALVRYGNTLTFYFGGANSGSKDVTGATFNSMGTGLGIAEMFTNIAGYQTLKGSLDEIRISKGIARWTSDFIPPAAPYCD